MGFLLGSIVAFPCFAAADGYSYSVGQGIEFSSGRYGTGTRTDSIYAPFTVTASPTERLGFLLEIPFVYQSSGNLVAGIATGGTQGGRSMMLSLPAGMGGMTGSGGSSMTGAGGGSASGLGDIVLKAGYILLAEEGIAPQVRPMVFVKFPTADKGRSLGTGAFDEGASVEISKWFGDWNPFAEVGYTLQGKSAQLPVRNYLTYNAGAGYQLSDRVRPILLVKGETAPVYGSGSLLEVRLKLKYQTTKQTGIDGYVAKGIATASPDFGTGISIYYDF